MSFNIFIIYIILKENIIFTREKRGYSSSKISIFLAKG